VVAPERTHSRGEYLGKISKSEMPYGGTSEGGRGVKKKKALRGITWNLKKKTDDDDSSRKGGSTVERST